MPDYYISNTYRFFTHGEGDISMLLAMVEMYDKTNIISKQIEVINTICVLSLTVEVDRMIRTICEQRDDWNKINIDNEYLDGSLVRSNQTQSVKNTFM